MSMFTLGSTSVKISAKNPLTDKCFLLLPTFPQKLHEWIKNAIWCNRQVVHLAVQVQCYELVQQTLLWAHEMPAVSMRGCTDPTGGTERWSHLTAPASPPELLQNTPVCTAARSPEKSVNTNLSLSSLCFELKTCKFIFHLYINLNALILNTIWNFFRYSSKLTSKWFFLDHLKYGKHSSYLL